MTFAPGDSLVVVKQFKTMGYWPKNWKKMSKFKFSVGADAVCLGGGRYTVQLGSFKSNVRGVELSDAEAAEYLTKRN